ncbi:MAG: endonuclease/exonuclease/phosphatase family protein [Rhodospirillales bacterium]|nr:endonuclease/exonuclease/phosphatase family protein [Rhodospirillales bacterium]
MTSTIIRTFETTRRRAARRKLRRMMTAARARMPSPIRSVACLTLTAALSLPAAVAIIHLSGARSWPFELAHHFVAPAGVGAAAVCVVAMLLRVRAVVLPALLLAVWFAVVWASAPLPAKTVAGSSAHAAVPLPAGSALTLVTNNVYVNNDRMDALVSWLASRPADVIVLQELAPELIKRLKRGDGSYPFRVVAEDVYVYDGGETTEAIAVLSRWPIIGSRPLNAETRGWQAMLVRIDVGGGVRPWIVAVHPALAGARRKSADTRSHPG